MNKIIAIYESLPKTVKVFGYLALSTILAELLIELGGLEQTFLVRITAQLINLGLVFIEQSAGVVKERFRK